MNEIDTQHGLTKWSAIPPDFRLEYTLDAKGCPVSNRVGLSQAQQAHMSENPGGWAMVRNWTETCGQELVQAMSKQLDIPAHQLIIMSDQQRMDTLEVWVRSRVPIPKKTIEPVVEHKMLAPPQHLKRSVSFNDKANEDIIDI